MAYDRAQKTIIWRITEAMFMLWPLILWINVMVFYNYFYPSVYSYGLTLNWVNFERRECWRNYSQVIERYPHCSRPGNVDNTCYGIAHHVEFPYNETSNWVTDYAYSSKFIYTWRGHYMDVFEHSSYFEAVEIGLKKKWHPANVTLPMKHTCFVQWYTDPDFKNLEAFILLDVDLSSWDLIDGPVYFCFSFFFLVVDTIGALVFYFSKPITIKFFNYIPTVDPFEVNEVGRKPETLQQFKEQNDGKDDGSILLDKPQQPTEQSLVINAPTTAYLDPSLLSPNNASMMSPVSATSTTPLFNVEQQQKQQNATNDEPDTLIEVTTEENPNPALHLPHLHMNQ